MKAGLVFLKVDLIFQLILGAIYLFTGFLGLVVQGFLMIALLAQLAIGAWQMMSALFFVILNREKQRITYLISVVCYLLLVGSVVALIDSSAIEGSLFLFIIGLVVIPIIFGAWYYLITLRYYQQILKNPALDGALITDMEGILDSDELIENHK